MKYLLNVVFYIIDLQTPLSAISDPQVREGLIASGWG